MARADPGTTISAILRRNGQSRQAGEFVRIKAQRETDSQNATRKEQRVRFRFRDRHFNREKNKEGRAP